MTELRKRMMEDLQLAGYSPRTTRSYIDTVRVLAKHYHRSPDLLTDEEIRDFFVHLVSERKLSRSSITVYLCGIKFFFEKTLKRKLPILDIVRPRPQKRLPVVLSQGEVQSVLKRVKRPVYRMALTIIYACGLRISEGIRLKTSDVDGQRGLLRVRAGKGGKDRLVPLHSHPLELLRSYYRAHGKGSPFLFPQKKAHIAADSLQKVFRAALKESGVDKPATVHTLRHSYATHLVENGLDIGTIKEILGHTSIVTTNIYTHLTERITARIHVSLDGMMTGLQQ
ncbi:tyrosine-type recombinase/integrase [Geomonas propionica]|uniref:Tyrosine-type recombinase/integrase n=1 Tax=Geomonas propionica TaxID=2798582 RepID=A0ABS0YT32_9BACT|nr:tyrosine-type recombinase/integrase [Geomonas propionica]MBJ6801132.1 tyrosine-type recombinase/integrase [Geomonas propionica]